MKNIVFIFYMTLTLSSCDLIIRGVSKKAVETVETIEQNEASKPKPKKNGDIKSFYKSGKIKTVIHYKDGMKDGKAVTYYENGNIKVSMFYLEGLKHGPSEYYYENGKLYRTSNYKNGVLDGIRKIYNNGKLQAEIPYKNGHTGKGLKEYYTNGKVKTDYPQLTFKEVDSRTKDHTYSIKVKFSKSHPKDKFYVGELLDGIFLHDDLYPLFVDQGEGRFPLDVSPNAIGHQTILFIGVHHTNLGNSYVTEYAYDLVIK